MDARRHMIPRSEAKGSFLLTRATAFMSVPHKARQTSSVSCSSRKETLKLGTPNLMVAHTLCPEERHCLYLLRLFTVQTPFERLLRTKQSEPLLAKCAETQETHGELSPALTVTGLPVLSSKIFILLLTACLFLTADTTGT